jgi:hypothetical protein
MVREVRFFECDCTEGVLERIATTGVRLGLACGEPGTLTGYYECSGCSKLFARQEYLGHEREYSDFKEFFSPLTRQEIIDNAPYCNGSIEESIGKILVQRDLRYLRKIKSLK